MDEYGMPSLFGGWAELFLLERLGLRPTCINEDGTEEEISYLDLTDEELAEQYGVHVAESRVGKMLREWHTTGTIPDLPWSEAEDNEPRT